MIVRYYAVYDKKASAYQRPFAEATDGSATRAFIDAVAQEGSGFARHAGDYELFFVGTFDDAAGLFVSSSPFGLLTAQQAVAALSPNVG